MHKDIESILLYENQLEKIVNTIAKQIEKDYNGKEFIMIGLLKGSVAFMVDLMKKIDLDTHILLPSLKGLPLRSMVCTEQRFTIDKQRLLKYCCSVPAPVMEEVTRACRKAEDSPDGLQPHLHPQRTVRWNVVRPSA